MSKVLKDKKELDKNKKAKTTATNNLCNEAVIHEKIENLGERTRKDLIKIRNNMNATIDEKINSLEKTHQNAIADLQVDWHRNEQIFKGFRNAFFALVFILCIVGCYLWLSKPISPKVIIWPEYDHTQPFNPYSDNNPVDSIAVGNPVLGGGAVSNPSKPTPFPGMDY